MKMRNKTIRLRRSKIILGIISLLLCYAPLLVALITGFSFSENERGKVTLSICCVVALLLTLINIISKYSVRSTMWVLLLGAYAVLEDVMPYLIAIAICTIIDEFIITPIYKSVKNRYIINREIDKV